MQKIILNIFLFFLVAFSLQLNAQNAKSDTTYKKFFIGSSFFVLSNLVPDDNAPDYYQLNFGYRLSLKDEVSLEIKTWKYAWSLGIPFGNSFEAPAEKFPGFIREYGFAFAYQHYFWRKLYASINVMNAWQSFYDNSKNKIGNGFQIFNTYRVGYHIEFFHNRFFIEPSIAVTHRPFHTEMPDSFKQLDNKWSKFFFGEPGLHFGINF